MNKDRCFVRNFTWPRQAERGQPMRPQVLMLGLAACLAGVGCADDEGTQDDPLTRREFCQRWATQACSDEVVSDCQAGSAEMCRRAQEAACLDRVPDTFDPEYADDCLSSVGDAYEDAQLEPAEVQTVLRLEGSCGRLTTGSRDEGESCEDDSDCDRVAGFECISKAGERSCQRPEQVGAGMTCEGAAKVCEDGFYCDGMHCVEQVEDDQPCDDTRECRAGTYCSEAGRCVDQLDLNMSCTSDERCASNLCHSFGDERVCVDRVQLSRSEPICDTFR
jgi:hypothetical protein